jgi:glutamate-1-semialdehyde 2,1-aminomutase
MNLLAPLGPVYQAGTLSGNPLAMAAGVATLEYLARHREAVYSNIEEASRLVAEGVATVLSEAGVPVATNRVGAMWTWFFTSQRVVDFATAAVSDTARFGAFHRAMLDAGIWLPPSQFEAMFLGTSHTAEVIDATTDAARQAVASLQETQPAR